MGEVIATDTNIEDSLTFSVTDEDSDFSFEGNQLKVTDNTILDYEVATQVTVNVQVSDGVLTDTAVITVNLTDDREEDFDGDGLTEAQEEDVYGTSDLNLNSDGDGYTDAEEVAVNRDPADPNNFPNEAPIMADQEFTIAERLTDVGEVIATDTNIEDSLTFTVTDEDSVFSFDGNQLKVTDNTVLDYEVNVQYIVNVQVSDGVLTDTAVITVNLTDDREEDFDGDGLTEAQEEDIHGTNDLIADVDGDGYTDGEEVAVNRDPLDETTFPNEAPIIDDQVFTIAERLTDVGEVIAADRNKEDTITYAVTDEETNFLFEGNQLKVTDDTILDYEVATTVTVNVQVSDGVLTDTAVITVNLTDDREEDFDGDGLTEAQEEDVYGTSDLSLDSDDDGYSDVAEIAVNRDPADPNNFPNEAPIMADQAFTIAERLTDVGEVIATDTNIEDSFTFTVTDEETNFLFEGNQLKVTDGTILDYEVKVQHIVNVQVLMAS